MQLTPTTLLSALCWTASVASAASGSVYTYDPASSHAHPRSLSPVAARLVLAQRAGVEQYHSADFDNDEVVDAINDFGARRSMFEEGPEELALILLDGVKESSASIPTLKDYTSFTVDPVPSDGSSYSLYHDLALQMFPSEEQTGKEKAAHVMRNNHIYHFHHVQTKSEVEHLFTTYQKKRNVAVTAMVMPLNGTSSTTTWGTYEMPESALAKRERPQKEQPLESISKVSAETSASPSSPLTAAAKNSTTTRVKGILPACFPSQSTCEKETHHCSGHGSCALKFTDKDVAPKSPAKNCYYCACTATETKDKNGNKKTTVWGGPACQKKDISVQFWLIALFSVGMMFLVSFAVGSVLSMGGEELPSVIGAGVSGPVKRS